MNNCRFEYGDKVRDTITGTVGYVTAAGYYFGRCPDKYLIEYQDTTGALNQDWIDADRLEPAI